MFAIAAPGWRIVHLTDREIELQKDDAIYRRVRGRDGYVKVYAEPGMDRKALINLAQEKARDQDRALAELVAKQITLRQTLRYQQRQKAWASVLQTPESEAFIGRKRA